MKRKLTAREWMLLGIFGILAIVCGYIMLFYNPTTSARDAALVEAEVCKEQTQAAQVRLAEKQRMERELDELFAQNPDPQPLADYDNLQPVMVVLNSILEPTRDYTLNFSTVDATRSIVRREISIRFTCDSYTRARSILWDLYNIKFRCMLNDLNIGIGQNAEDRVSVNGSIVFFECQTQ